MHDPTLARNQTNLTLTKKKRVVELLVGYKDSGDYRDRYRKRSTDWAITKGENIAKIIILFRFLLYIAWDVVVGETCAFVQQQPPPPPAEPLAGSDEPPWSGPSLTPFD